MMDMEFAEEGVPLVIGIRSGPPDNRPVMTTGYRIHSPNRIDHRWMSYGAEKVYISRTIAIRIALG